MINIAAAAKSLTDYRVVESPILEIFLDECREALQAGWVPLGGVFVIQRPNYGTLVHTQAFVK